MPTALIILPTIAAAATTTTINIVDIITTTQTTTITPGASPMSTSTTTSLQYPTPGELATYGGGLSASSGPSVVQSTSHDGCSAVVSASLPSGSTYISTSFCYKPTHKPPKPRKSATYVLHFFTNLIHAPSSESLAATETTLEVSMRPTAMMDSRTTVLTSLTSSSTKTSPLLSGAPINATAAKLCISARGGVQGDNSVAAGCGAIFQHLTTCFDSLGPWIDPYNTTQSTSFQACMCETNATSPFDTNSLLWRNFIGCSSCLEMFSAGISLDTLAQEFLSIEDFCRSQNPVACLALASFETWLAAINEGTTLPTPPLTGGITQLAALSSAFTTTPPLANLAYGASAPFDGTLADVTPQLMTQTITVPPTGTTSGSSSLQVITMLVDWVATATATGTSAPPCNPQVANASAASVPASNLQGALSSLSTIGQGGPSQQCHGKCPNGAARRGPPLSILAWSGWVY